MTVPPSDPDRYRRQQRRRGLIAWASVLAVVAVVALAAALGGEDSEPQAFRVPYGETLTSAEYDEIEEGDDQAEVLESLGKSGRPERLTKDYVLILFSPPSEDVACSYWEFSDEPQIFARLCFDRSDGELVEKRARNVHRGLEEGGEGTITA